MKKQDKLRTKATIPLLKGPATIIVNPGLSKDKDHVLDSLQKHDVSDEAVEGCICLNGSIDYMGNLNILPKAVFIASHDMCLSNICHRHDSESGQLFTIDELLDVIPTPGKASTDISVIVKGTELGTVAIVGDLFQCQEDMEDPTWRAGSRNPDGRLNLFQVVGRCSKCPCKVDSNIKASCFLLCKECTVYLHVTLNSAVH